MTVVSRDRITFEPTPTGTRVTYDADLKLVLERPSLKAVDAAA